MRDQSLAHETHPRHAGPERWLTTAIVAKMLQTTRQGVQWLASEKSGQQLACEWTVTGQRLFRLQEVLRHVARRERAWAQARGGWVVLRSKRRVRPGEWRQPSLFGPRLRLVDLAGAKYASAKRRQCA